MTSAPLQDGHLALEPRQRALEEASLAECSSVCYSFLFMFARNLDDIWVGRGSWPWKRPKQPMPSREQQQRPTRHHSWLDSSGDGQQKLVPPFRRNVSACLLPSHHCFRNAAYSNNSIPS